jgi:SulP family sulfate permease
MNVDSTSATSIATGDFMASISSADQQGYLVVLGILVGLWMLAFGILKLGFLVRFISNSVMTGFLSGLGVLTILGQVGDLTGYYSDASNKVFKTIDTIINWQERDRGPNLAHQVRTVRLCRGGRGRYATGFYTDFRLSVAGR